MALIGYASPQNRKLEIAALTDFLFSIFKPV